jgi:hypothetical protein
MTLNDQIEQLAIRAALGNNGGTWAKHYTEDQKEFWRKFVRDLCGAALSIEVVKLREALTDAKNHIEWWATNHPCCHGTRVEEETIKKIDAALGEAR